VVSGGMAMNGWNILLAVENGIGEMQALVSG